MFTLPYPFDENPFLEKARSCVLARLNNENFGAAQRAKLWKKSEPHPPHVLVMTATPIPRTLAMTLYGDLDASVIDELPPGRQEITTIHRTDNHRMRVIGFMREQIGLGRQVFVVYPLIEESEALDW
jgi:ATP-dependent DNA helicase RecG